MNPKTETFRYNKKVTGLFKGGLLNPKTLVNLQSNICHAKIILR